MWAEIAEFFSSSYENITPFVVTNQYEKGVVLRFGKYHRDLVPGLSYKIPLIEATIKIEAVQTTMHILPQTLTTADNISVTTSAVLQYEISDPKPFTVDVWEPRDAMNDIAMAEIKRAISGNEWVSLQGENIEKKILRRIRKQLQPYGVSIKRFGFIDIGRIRTIRIINSTPEAE